MLTVHTTLVRITITCEGFFCQFFRQQVIKLTLKTLLDVSHVILMHCYHDPLYTPTEFYQNPFKTFRVIVLTDRMITHSRANATKRT